MEPLGEYDKMKISVVGCGGIGSYFAEHLKNLYETEQLKSVREILLFDDDEVEPKNLKYQNFKAEDLYEYKSAALALRFGDPFSFIIERVTDFTHLFNSRVIVGAVDNSQFRKLMYENLSDKNSAYWIDLRSEGTSVAFFTKHEENSLEAMLKTIDVDNKESTSCQLTYELENNVVQMGNKIIATIGAQLLLNFLRGNNNPPRYIHRF
jgi:molybdopterin/thiamine biosynthesis adenylyltransferase